MDKDKVLSLARLARIDMNETEAVKLSQEFAGILKYVEEVQSIDSVDVTAESSEAVLKNVFREDGEPHVSGLYTEKILGQAPHREGNYFKVKKIL